MKAMFAAALLLLAACQVEEPSPGTGAVIEAVPTSEADCRAAGGRWSHGGLSPYPMCFQPNADAGTACARATHCQGACLADSRTCAPERPIFGCYGFLDASGGEVTICVD